MYPSGWGLVVNWTGVEVNHSTTFHRLGARWTMSGQRFGAEWFVFLLLITGSLTTVFFLRAAHGFCSRLVHYLWALLWPQR